MEIPVHDRQIVIDLAKKIMAKGHDPLEALKMAEQEIEKQKKVGEEK